MSTSADKRLTPHEFAPRFDMNSLCGFCGKTTDHWLHDYSPETLPNNNGSGLADSHVVHPSPKEAPDWLTQVLEKVFRAGIAFERDDWITGRHLFLDASEAKAAIAQHIAEQVEAELRQIITPGFTAPEGGDMRDKYWKGYNKGWHDASNQYTSRIMRRLYKTDELAKLRREV